MEQYKRPTRSFPIILLVTGVTLLTLGGGFSRVPETPPPLPDGMTWSAIQRPESMYYVMKVDLSKCDLRMHWNRGGSAPFRSIASWAAALEAHGHRLDFATNGGIFGKDFKPLGLYIENGRELYAINLKDGDGNFFAKPNGVFYLGKGTSGIVAADEWASIDASAVTFAVQSGPLLVRDGQLHPKFTPAGDTFYVRNGVGMSNDREAYFVLSAKPVNMHAFASFFLDTLACQDALYLDGAISKFHAPSQGITGDGPFVTVIGVISPKAE